MERGDSDGEDAMAYFLPNGITDDSPPKRSTLGLGGFGPIGGRFGGLHQASPRTTTSTSLFGNSLSGSDSLTNDPAGSTTSASSATRPSFLLSDLGGEIHEPRINDSGHLIGGGRHANPFAFSGAFPSDSIGRAFENPRSDLGSSELFPSSSSGGLAHASSLYGQPTLNVNAPVFMASSQPESLSMSSPSAASSGWPTATTATAKPRRAPPGLSKPTDDLSPVPAMTRSSAEKQSATLSHPPGLARPSPFGGVYSTASASGSSFFSDSSANQFSSGLQPHYASLSDPFMSGVPPQDRAFKSALSELNSKSMSVEEVQSSLAATAIAAAHDVVDDEDEDSAVVPTTPRRAAKSPRQTPDFGRGKPPHGGNEEKRKGGDRSSTDPRLRTPTRRTENNMVAATTPGAASPAQGRRGRNAREPAGSETPTRGGSASAKSDANVKTSRRARGAAGGHVLSDVRPEPRESLADAIASGSFQSTLTRKKPPSSVSSVGSDDQLLAISTLIEVAEEGTRVKESPREQRTARNTQAKNKSSSSAQIPDKRAVSRRQVYREKHAAAEVAADHSVKVEKHVSHAGSDADASGGESQTDDASAKERKATSSESPAGVSQKSSEQPPKALTPKKKAPAKAKPTVTTASPVAKAEETSTSGSNSPEKVELPVSPINTDTLKSTPVSPSTESVSETATRGTVAADFDLSATPKSPRVNEDATATAFAQHESDSGSEIPESIPRGVRHESGRKISTKEQKKEKHKKEKSEKKKSASTAKSNKKEKRDSSSSGKGELVGEESFSATPTKKSSPPTSFKVATAVRDCRLMVKRVVMSVWSALWFLCTEFADRINLKGFLGWSFSYIESFLAVVFSVVLLLSLHGASWFIRIHRVAFRAVLTHRHVGFCFAFLYAFPYLVQYVFPWAPPWAPVCLWYAFLVQLFCTSGPTAMVATFRIVIPLLFVVEGISHHSFLLDLNGAELLLASFILSAMKTSNLCSPIFLLSFAIQCLSAVFLGSEFVVQWFQMALALYSLHAMAATDEDWAGLGDEEDDVSCRPMAMHHHSIADYNYNPLPSAPQIQKTKRLDRRALAYVRGRKFR